MGVHGTSGSPKWFPRTPKSHPKISKWRSQASQNHISPMFSNACHTNHQMHVDRGPAAEGVALKIRRTPRRGAAGRDGITTEVLAETRIQGAHPLPPAPTPKTSKSSKISDRNKNARELQNGLLLGPRRAPKIAKSVRKRRSGAPLNPFRK